ncbi:trigger factor [Pelagibacterales bacterium SAG-MED15]|nr:trigger factor [Pelagibacterales bacterium SAG-MED15]
MKVTVQNKNGLNKDLKVLVDKKTLEKYLNEKYEEVSKTVQLKGFRPGKVPKEVLKRQFGKAIYGEVLDKVLKETTTKAITDNNIKPAGQPKIDLKSFGEDKDLEYIISVTELPKIDLKQIENIKADEYEVTIESKEIDNRISEIAKNQKNFVDVDPAKVANEGDLVAFDYKATVDGNDFKGNEGKNTQLELGKDLFIKGFDKQLIKVKKDETVDVEVTLPENFPEKGLVGKKAKFVCKIISVKKSKEVEINDEFAKNLGAKDLSDLRKLIEKQINEEYKNSLNMITKKQILDQIEKYKIDEIPENLIEQEIKILSQGLKEEDIKLKKKEFEIKAKQRIKVGLILNEYGEQNKIKVEESEMQGEIQKQLRMMPGQEKFLMEYYQKNPSAVASLRGNIYEEKIITSIMSKSKTTKKKVGKTEAEKLIKEQNEKDLKQVKEASSKKDDVKTKKADISKKSTPIKKKTTKKVSKK